MVCVQGIGLEGVIMGYRRGRKICWTFALNRMQVLMLQGDCQMPEC